MIDFTTEATCPSIQTLVDNKVASRIRAKDATLYNFEPEAQECAQDYMGWTTLASNPPTEIEEIQNFAYAMMAKGVKTILLIGQGGSTQAPMTLTKYNKTDSSMVFKTLDSVSPVRVRTILSECDPKTTLVIQSSKSGGTIEPCLVMKAVRDILAETLDEAEIPQHLVAITDPGSDLEKQAREEGWLHIFSGEPTVGGRYSALSVFGLVPAALVGINLNSLIAYARKAEVLCGSDSVHNPAIVLAAFLYDNYRAGRDKFSFFSPKRGRVLGLWIEQLVAESLGKNGKGILPNIEIDSLMLSQDPKDRTIITYDTKIDLWDEQQNYKKSIEYINKDIPRINYQITTVNDLAAHFIMWEYAIAMAGYLMEVCPFDQPDVAVAKSEVLHILSEGAPEPTIIQEGIDDVPVGKVEVRVSDALLPDLKEKTLEGALSTLMNSLKFSDYFSIHAFVPFTGEGRREAMEEIRHAVPEHFGVASCLEIGPRYLHSTGQLHKGGPNNGVFLIIYTEETKDLPVDDARANSLGMLGKAQSLGDFSILSSRGRRCVHVQLPDSSAVTLRMLAKTLKKVVASCS